MCEMSEDAAARNGLAATADGTTIEADIILPASHTETGVFIPALVEAEAFDAEVTTIGGDE